MPPAGDVGGDDERRPADQGAVDLPRIDPHLELARRNRSARLRVDRDVHRLTVWNVDHETGLEPFPADDDGRQHSSPRCYVAFGQGVSHLLLSSGGNVQGREDAAERVVTHVVALLIPTPVRRRDPVPGREVTQLLGVRHPTDRARSPRNLRG